jgi:hypothetical protein
MVDGNTNLNATFHVRQLYDFSKVYAVSFRWWGADLGDIVDLKLGTPTGSFVTAFPDGAASFREVLIPWSRFNEVSVVGSRPDKSQITDILWTVHSPGVRRLDRFAIIEVPYLKGFFVIRRISSEEVKASFVVRAASSVELDAEFTIS